MDFDHLDIWAQSKQIQILQSIPVLLSVNNFVTLGEAKFAITSMSLAPASLVIEDSLGVSLELLLSSL